MTDLPAIYWVCIVKIISPILHLLSLKSKTLMELSQKVCTAELYFKTPNDSRGEIPQSLRDFLSKIGGQTSMNSSQTDPTM